MINKIKNLFSKIFKSSNYLYKCKKNGDIFKIEKKENKYQIIIVLRDLTSVGNLPIDFNSKEEAIIHLKELCNGIEKI